MCKSFLQRLNEYETLQRGNLLLGNSPSSKQGHDIYDILGTLQVITDVVPINPQAHESEYQEDMINIYSQLAKACSGEPLSWENLNLSNSLIDFIVIAMSLHHFHIHINIYTQTQTFYKHDTLP